MAAIWRDRDDVLLKLYIQPKASRDQIIGCYDQALKIAISAPPLDGKANAQLCKFLAKQFKTAKSNIVIEKGAQGRHKQIRIRAPKVIPEAIIGLIT